ncbi:MAG: phosphotransferase enzyme family protein [Sandaracinaceae bacterium]
MNDPIPAAVRRAFDLEGDAEPVSGGWINDTYFAARAGVRVVVQRLHPIFSGEVNDDIDRITERLDAEGLLTPRLVRSSDGASFVTSDGVWRVITFVAGQTFDALTPSRARSAGRLVGRFHQVARRIEHDFSFTRPGAHDTAAHLNKLRGLVGTDDRFDAHAARVLTAAAALPTRVTLPTQVVHGDLKATNLRFDERGEEAIALLDLDTLAHGTVDIDLGDALRSWCNVDEANPAATFDLEVFSAALEGWAEGGHGVFGRRDGMAVVAGVETLALELASRFAADLYEDCYFGFDPTRFASRRAHNRARTEGQLALSLSVRAQREALRDVVESVFS